MSNTLSLTTESQDVCTFSNVPNHAIYVIRFAYNKRGTYPIAINGNGGANISQVYDDIPQYQSNTVVILGHSNNTSGTQTVTLNLKAIGGSEDLTYCSATLYAIPY